MPELPEVQSVVDTLAPHLPGRVIARVELLRSDMVSHLRFTRPKPGTAPASLELSEHLEGRTVAAVTRRAKRIVFTLDDQSAFYIHLGMTGRISLAAPTDPRPPHTHLVVHLAIGPDAGACSSRGNLAHSAVLFSDPRRFGRIVYLGLPPHPEEDLGPEPLELATPTLVKLLSKANRPLKPALLDQTLIAGLGNIYVDEALHAARLHPLRKASSLTPPEVATLNRHIKRILKLAIKARGSTLRDYRDAAGNPGAFQTLHKVYDKAGHPCPHCRHPIERTVIGGRSTHFCPRCQKK